ncbi:hypothetical protein CVT24_006493, partial [Panaeolus cyanescens]
PGGSLFGNATQQTQTNATGSSLFGGANTGTNTGTTGGSLFGNTAGTNTGGGLFGNTATNTTNPGTTTGGGLFGNTANTTAPTGGGLFGSTAANTNTNATQPAGGSLFANTQTGGSLFGAKPATTGGLFGSTAAAAPAQTAGTGSLFGGSLVLKEFTTLGIHRLETADSSRPKAGELVRTTTNDAMWEKAVRENPDPSCLVPVIAIGFDDLRARIDAQTAQSSMHLQKLNELQSRLKALTTEHSVSNSSRLLRASAQQTQLTQRLMRLVQHQHPLIPAKRMIPNFPADKARPLWERWARYEHQYGDLEASLKLERRMAEVYASDPPIKRFAQRHMYLGTGAITDRDLGFAMARRGTSSSNGTSTSLGRSGTSQSLLNISSALNPTSSSNNGNTGTSGRQGGPSTQTQNKRPASPDYGKRDDSRGDFGSGYKRQRPLNPGPGGRGGDRDRERDRDGPGDRRWDGEQRGRGRGFSPAPQGNWEREGRGSGGTGRGREGGARDRDDDKNRQPILPPVLSYFIGELPQHTSFDGEQCSLYNLIIALLTMSLILALYLGLMT